MKLVTLGMTLWFSLLLSTVFANHIQVITGIVVDKKGEAITDATIMEYGNPNNITHTNSEGRFELISAQTDRMILEVYDSLSSSRLLYLAEAAEVTIPMTKKQMRKSKKLRKKLKKSSSFIPLSSEYIQLGKGKHLTKEVVVSAYFSRKERSQEVSLVIHFSDKDRIQALSTILSSIIYEHGITNASIIFTPKTDLDREILEIKSKASSSH